MEDGSAPRLTRGACWCENVIFYSVQVLCPPTDAWEHPKNRFCELLLFFSSVTRILSVLQKDLGSRRVTNKDQDPPAGRVDRYVALRGAAGRVRRHG